MNFDLFLLKSKNTAISKQCRSDDGLRCVVELSVVTLPWRR